MQRTLRSPLFSHPLNVACLNLALAAAFAAAGCKSAPPVAAQKSEAAPRKVRLAKVAETPVERVISVNGALAAYDQATISLKVPGRLSSIGVDLGTVVRAGQVVAEVDRTDYDLRVKQAEAALAQARVRLGLSPDGADDAVDAQQTGSVRRARATLDQTKTNRDRLAVLFQQGVAARADLDLAEQNYEVAQGAYQDALEEIRNRQGVLAQRRSELALARQQLADAKIVAPFDGVVQERRASVGEYLAAGAPVATIVKIDPLRLRAEVPERDAPDVRAGQIVRVAVEGDATPHSGKVVRISPSITEQSRTLIVEAEVRNRGELRPGAFARAEIVTQSSTLAVTVPPKAVVTFAGIEKVVTVKDGKAVEKPVTTGRRAPEWTEIVTGVKPGDEIVAEPGNLQSGQPVSVTESN
jgi:RND family efflux transporter MFP subunit